MCVCARVHGRCVVEWGADRSRTWADCERQSDLEICEHVLRDAHARDASHVGDSDREMLCALSFVKETKTYS